MFDNGCVFYNEPHINHNIKDVKKALCTTYISRMVAKELLYPTKALQRFSNDGYGQNLVDEVLHVTPLILCVVLVEAIRKNCYQLDARTYKCICVNKNPLSTSICGPN